MAENAWERIDGESDPAWRAFMLYRDMGPSRTLNRVGAELRGSRAAGRRSAFSRLYEWSSKWCWVERCRTYDAHLDNERVRAAEELARAMGQRWAQRGEDLRERAWSISERLLNQADSLSRFPVVTQSRSADGLTTTFEAVDPRTVKIAALVLQLAQSVAIEAIRGEIVDQEATVTASIAPGEIEAARRELFAWHEERDRERRETPPPPRIGIADGTRSVG